jgi:hypothetical protein
MDELSDSEQIDQRKKEQSGKIEKSVREQMLASVRIVK